MPAAMPPPDANIIYRRQFVRCGKPACRRCAAGTPGHGPYWYAFWRAGGRLRSRYVGKHLPPDVETSSLPDLAMQQFAALPNLAPASPVLEHSPAPAPVGGASALTPAATTAVLPPLRVCTLGGFAVWWGLEAIPGANWSRRKAGTLFKALLAAPGQRLHREQAAELLWPETDAGSGAQNLRAALHQLRKTLGSHGHGPGYLWAKGELLALDPAPGTVPAADWNDAPHFAALADAALREQDAGACRAALAVYGGDYLPDDLYLPWVADRREHLRGRQIALQVHLAALCLGQGERAEAEALLRLVLAADPCHEQAARSLMHLIGNARRAEALRIYEALAAALRANLAITPGVQTEALRAELQGAVAPARELVEPAPLPSGIVSFLLTEIAGSTAFWEQQPAEMQVALDRHEAILAEGIAGQRGALIKSQGTAPRAIAVFARPSAALAAACALQQALLAERWTTAVPLRVRMALHVGEAHPHEGQYVGVTVDRCARLRGLAHGGQVLLTQTAADLLADQQLEGVGLVALGTHQLKGPAQSELVYQLLHPTLPAQFPPLHAPEAPRSNLPMALTSFIGREAEVGAVRRLLTESRLLTLTGAGGTGKTRLALQAAGDLGEAIAGGVWLVELAPLGDGALAPRALAGVLGVREEPARPLSATLAEYLRDRELLLVLDNCEHLLGACAELAAALLEACPRLRILATSREALGITGERVWRVPTLTLPPPHKLPALDQLERYEAVRLFCERGALVQTGFALSEQNAWAVGAICRRFDGLPLALELAAARLLTLSVEEIAGRLGDCFRLLTGGSRTALPRQQTLRATLDWSYELLNEQERLLLQRLSVFAGGWTLEAAEVVCAGNGIEQEEVLDLLSSLVQKSLVEPHTAAEPARYSMLQTVRQYGQERLAAAGEESVVQERHLAWCLALAERAEPLLTGPEQGDWLERLEAEHDNLRAALHWGAGVAGTAASGLRLSVALSYFWGTHDHVSEGRQWFEQGLRTGAGVGAALRAKALHRVGYLAYRQDDFPEARSLLAEGLALSRELGDKSGVALALYTIGIVAWTQGDYPEARTVLERSVALYRELGPKAYLATALSMLGCVALEQGDYVEGRSLCAEGLTLSREVGYKHGSAFALNCLGEAALQQGAFPEARARLEESLALNRELGDTTSVAPTLCILGWVAREQGDHREARSLFAESLALCRELGIKLSIASCLEGLGGLAVARNETRRAILLFGATEAWREGNGAPLPPSVRARYERDCGLARAAQGDEAFAATWAVGRALSLEQAIAVTVQDNLDVDTRPPRTSA